MGQTQPVKVILPWLASDSDFMAYAGRLDAAHGR